MERLAYGPSAVGELARDLPVSRPAVSQHLKVLKAAGLVCDRAAGTRRVYQESVRAGQRDSVEQFAARSPPKLVELTGSHLQPRGRTAGSGGMIALVDGMIPTDRTRSPPCLS